MKFKQSILALFFLAIYSLGFCHGVVPHCESESISSETHTHEHHEHGDDDSDDGHIVHADHFDEGIYDYIICLMVEMNHDEDGCNFHHCAKVNLQDISLKQVSDIEFLAVLVSFLDLGLMDSDDVDFSESKVDFALYTIANSISHRGPPQFSC